jgi:hypothetical protein
LSSGRLLFLPFHEKSTVYGECSNVPHHEESIESTSYPMASGEAHHGGDTAEDNAGGGNPRHYKAVLTVRVKTELSKFVHVVLLLSIRSES